MPIRLCSNEEESTMKKDNLPASAGRKPKYKGGMVENPSIGERIADVIIWIILLACMFVCILPMWHTLMASLSDGQMLIAHEGVAWKWITQDGKPNFDGYIKTITYSDSALIKSYGITILYVVGNVLIGLVINVIGAYVLYRAPKAAPALTLFILLTMMFGGGVVPTYMVVRGLGMTQTPLSLILPGCTNAMFMILILNGFKQVPVPTVEAAELDGAGHFTVMFRVLLPQARGLTVVSMINTAILSWNAWFEASIYVTNQKEYWPLQLWIKQIVADNANIINASVPDWDKYLVQYCVILIATLPVLIAMPFAQKLLQKGALMGGVKE